MKKITQTAVIFAVAAVLAGCGRRSFTYQPVPPTSAQQSQQKATHTYDHQLRPEPNYDPSENDGLAERLTPPRRDPMPIFKRRVPVVRQSTKQPRHVENGYYDVTDNRWQDDDDSDYWWRKGRHYTNTVFWGGAGALVGSAYGHTERGAAVGAAYGHLLDHDGVSGLLSTGTIGGAAVGAAFSGNRTKGAIWGAITGHLLDDLFGRD